MRHRVSGRKLGRTTEHRWSLFRNQVVSLVQHERIETTLPKAKELRKFAEKLITIGKKDTLAARRRSFDFTRSRKTVTKLFNELAPRFKDRNGGYTRILKLGSRLGDGAAMALIEYLPGEAPAKPVEAKTESKTKAKPKAKAKAKTSPKKAKKS